MKWLAIQEMVSLLVLAPLFYEVFLFTVITAAGIGYVGLGSRATLILPRLAMAARIFRVAGRPLATARISYRQSDITVARC
jgi:hypothetical protein